MKRFGTLGWRHRKPFCSCLSESISLNKTGHAQSKKGKKNQSFEDKGKGNSHRGWNKKNGSRIYGIFSLTKKKKNLPIDGAWTLGIEYEGREDARLNVTMATDCKKVQR